MVQGALGHARLGQDPIEARGLESAPVDLLEGGAQQLLAGDVGCPGALFLRAFQHGFQSRPAPYPPVCNVWPPAVPNPASLLSRLRALAADASAQRPTRHLP